MWIRDCTNGCDWYLVDPLNNPYSNYLNQPPGYNDIYDVELNDIILEPQDNSSGIIFNQGNGLTSWYYNSCKIHKKDRPDSQGGIHGYYGTPITVFGNILPTIHVRDTEVTNGTNSTGEGLGIFECSYYINNDLKYWIRFDELQEIYKPNWATFFNHKYNTALGVGHSVLHGNHDYIKMHRLTTDQYCAPHKVIDRGIWKTRVKQGSYTLITDIPQNAQYLDGYYDVDFSVWDAAENRDDASNKIKVDNFLPFITNFHLWSLSTGGFNTIFEYNRAQYENGATLNNGILSNETASFDNSNTVFTVYPTVFVSEPMKEMSVRYSTNEGITWTAWEDMNENSTNPLIWQTTLSGYEDGCILFNFKGKDKSNNDIINVYEITQQNTIGENMFIPTRNGKNSWNNTPAHIGEDFFSTCTNCATQIEGVGKITINRTTGDCDDISDFEETVIVDCDGNTTIKLSGLNTEKYNVGWKDSDGVYQLGESVHSGIIGENCYIIESLDGCCNYVGCIVVTGKETYINSNFSIEFSDSYDEYHKQIEFSVIEGQNLAYPITVTYFDDDGNYPCSPNLISPPNDVSSCYELLIGVHYCVIFEDANGCSQEYCFTTEGQICPEELNISLEGINNVCEENLGSISISVDGNCKDYTLSWANGQSGFKINELAVGSYCITVQGNNDCEDCKTVQCFEIIEEDNCDPCIKPNDVDAVTVDICIFKIEHYPSGDGDVGYTELVKSYGWIFVEASGGKGILSISWMDGSTAGWKRKITKPGQYCAEITDECGKSVVQCWEIVINNSDRHCKVPYLSEGFWVSSFREGLDLVESNWGIFAQVVSLSDSIYLDKVYEGDKEVKYFIKLEAEDDAIGTVRIARNDKNKQVKINRVSAKIDAFDYSKDLIPKSKDINIRAYPNPFKDNLLLEIESKINSNSTISIYEIGGKELNRIDVFIGKGLNLIDLTKNIIDLPSGMLTIVVRSDTGFKKSVKIIKY